MCTEPSISSAAGLNANLLSKVFSLIGVRIGFSLARMNTSGVRVSMVSSKSLRRMLAFAHTVSAAP